MPLLNNERGCLTSTIRITGALICPKINEYVNYRSSTLHNSNNMSNNSYDWFDYDGADGSTSTFSARDKFRFYASTIGVVIKPAKIRIDGKINFSLITGSASVPERTTWSSFNSIICNAYFNHSSGLYVKLNGNTIHPWHKELSNVNVHEGYVDFDCN